MRLIATSEIRKVGGKFFSPEYMRTRAIRLSAWAYSGSEGTYFVVSYKKEGIRHYGVRKEENGTIVNIVNGLSRYKADRKARELAGR